MPEPTNTEIATALDELGDLYELDGAIVHRVVAYRNAAKAVRDAPVSVTALARQGERPSCRGSAGRSRRRCWRWPIRARSRRRSSCARSSRPGCSRSRTCPASGPKRARRLFEELGIDSLDALETAAEEHRIRTLKGFGPKAEETLLARASAAGAGSPRERVVLDRALAIGEQLVGAQRASGGRAGRARRLGRRMTDSVKDLDVIATAHDPGRWLARSPSTS
jgi:DNA polymerase (family 10)